MTRTSIRAFHPVATVLACGLLVGGSLAGCSDGSSRDSTTPAAQRGRQIYENVCIVCHNADPTQPGSLGPPVAGASLALLEAKLLRGEYPPGYTPLRPSQSMPRFEYLKDRLPDLAAYLEQD